MNHALDVKVAQLIKFMSKVTWNRARHYRASRSLWASNGRDDTGKSCPARDFVHQRKVFSQVFYHVCEAEHKVPSHLWDCCETCHWQMSRSGLTVPEGTFKEPWRGIWSARGGTQSAMEGHLECQRRHSKCCGGASGVPEGALKVLWRGIWNARGGTQSAVEGHPECQRRHSKSHGGASGVPE